MRVDDDKTEKLAEKLGEAKRNIKVKILRERERGREKREGRVGERKDGGGGERFKWRWRQ